MFKRQAAKWAVFFVLAIMIVVPFQKVLATTYAKQFSQWIQNSLIDNTPIGSTTPSTGAFTTASASGGFTGSLTGNASTATALAATPTPCAAPTPALGIAANGNASCDTSVVARIVALHTVTTCSLASDADGNWSCSASFSWGITLPNASYAIDCMRIYPTSGFNISKAEPTSWVVEPATITTTGFTYLLTNHASGSNGASFSMTCFAVD